MPQHEFSMHTQMIKKVFVLNANTVATSSKDLTVVVWNMHSGERQHTLTGHTDSVLDLLQHDNLLLGCTNDGTVQIWNLDTGQRIRLLEGSDGECMSKMALNQDVTLLATAISDGTMDFWDIASVYALRPQLPNTPY